MVRLPDSHERVAARAVLHPELREAKRRSGSGANQSSGHLGLRPVPNQTNTAVDTTASRAAKLRLQSFANATDVPPEGPPVEGAKLGGRYFDSSAQVEHDETVG